MKLEINILNCNLNGDEFEAKMVGLKFKCKIGFLPEMNNDLLNLLFEVENGLGTQSSIFEFLGIKVPNRKYLPKSTKF